TIENGEHEEDAARAVLGVGLDEIGRWIGKRWGFPLQLVDSLKHMPPTDRSVDAPLDHAEWLAAISTMSTRCADVLCESGSTSDDIDVALEKIAGNYAGMLGLDTATVFSAVELAQQLAKEEAL